MNHEPMTYQLTIDGQEYVQEAVALTVTNAGNVGRKGYAFLPGISVNDGLLDIIVYIHCRQGLGRGPSMAIAYLLKMGATYDDALATVKRVRSFINPRPVQVQRLKELEMYFREQDVAVKELVPKV